MANFLDKVYNYIKYPAAIPFVPGELVEPHNKIDIISAWKGHDLILADIIKRFELNTHKCLEFGVEFGFSTVALSSFFDKVTGVDIFIGDDHTLHKGDHFIDTQKRLEPFNNIQLIKADYKDFIKNNKELYDLIHVDIVHTYEDTFACGFWSTQHSTCTIFHDTESFPLVKRAIYDIAKQTNKRFYNYPKHYGLGILV